MARDTLFLLTPGFAKAEHSGSFVCPECNALEGLLATYPALAAKLDVVRVPFPRPRAPVVAALGEANQGLPALQLGDSAHTPPAEALQHGDTKFLNTLPSIVAALAQRHGFPLFSH